MARPVVTYNLTITEEQLQVLSTACEVFSRIGMGQVSETSAWIPKASSPSDREDVRGELNRLEDLLRRQLRYRGIAESEYAPRVAFDLYQVIRHRLAWDKLAADGKTKPSMPLVTYDEPFQVATEVPLAKVAKIALNSSSEADCP